MGPSPSAPASLVVLASTAFGAAGLFAVIAYSARGLGSAALALPVLYAAGVLSAWLGAYLMAARARVLDDEALRWAAWAYALLGFALLCLALAAPGFLLVDVALPVGATPNGSALLRLIGVGGVALFMLGGLAAPGLGGALRGGMLGGLATLLGLVLWSPGGLPLPTLVAGTEFTGAYRVLVAVTALVVLAAAAGWVRRVGPRPTWTEAWIPVGLACLLAHVVLSGVAAGSLSVAWWGALGLLLAGVIGPALGLLADLPRQLHDLHQHAVGLRGLLDHELELAAASNGDPADAIARVTALLDSGEFRPVFQPIFDLATLRPVGAEALTRFQGVSPQPPGVWFGWAREAGLTPELEMATARTALAYLANVPSELYVSVNLSPATLQRRLIAEILGVIPPHRLVVEVTEHDAIDSYEELNEALRVLRSRGVRLAVDDTGAGFSSLRHIVRTRPDVIKLDISLVHDLDSDPVRHALTASLVAFGERIGATIVAEGIETAEELAAVRELGVGFGQGFYLARPGPVGLLLHDIHSIDLTAHERARRGPPRR